MYVAESILLSKALLDIARGPSFVEFGEREEESGL